mmetsp:Transcript_162527/g.520995  ORF Transcript_162527/g.520995 Transcript_162527/m.520995 type:complete len:255 (-) Transcript_162527:876-1640(-)
MTLTSNSHPLLLLKSPLVFAEELHYFILEFVDPLPELGDLNVREVGVAPLRRELVAELPLRLLALRQLLLKHGRRLGHLLHLLILLLCDLVYRNNRLLLEDLQLRHLPLRLRHVRGHRLNGPEQLPNVLLRELQLGLLGGGLGLRERGQLLLQHAVHLRNLALEVVQLLQAASEPRLLKLRPQLLENSSECSLALLHATRFSLNQLLDVNDVLLKLLPLRHEKLLLLLQRLLCQRRPRLRASWARDSQHIRGIR